MSVYVLPRRERRLLFFFHLRATTAAMKRLSFSERCRLETSSNVLADGEPRDNLRAKECHAAQFSHSRAVAVVPALSPQLRLSIRRLHCRANLRHLRVEPPTRKEKKCESCGMERGRKRLVQLSVVCALWCASDRAIHTANNHKNPGRT